MKGRADFHVAVDGGGDAPVPRLRLRLVRQSRAQDLLHLRDEMRRDEHVLPAPFALQRDLQAVEIAERLVHVGFVDLDIAELDGGVALDDAVGGGLAHDLRVDDRVLRHVDDEIAQDLRRAGQAAALRQAADAVVALFLGAARRDVVVGRDDLVLGEIAFLHLDLAAAAGGASAAHALDIDAELARGVEHGGADGKAPALAGRHEQDEGVGGVDAGRSRFCSSLTPGPSAPRGRRGGGRRRPRAFARRVDLDGAGAWTSPGL